MAINNLFRKRLLKEENQVLGPIPFVEHSSCVVRNDLAFEMSFKYVGTDVILG